VLSKAWRLIAF